MKIAQVFAHNSNFILTPYKLESAGILLGIIKAKIEKPFGPLRKEGST